MLEAALLIDNEPVAAAATFERIDPVTRAVATRAAAASVEDAEHAANVAARAFAQWSASGPAERRDHLNAAADVLLARSG